MKKFPANATSKARKQRGWQRSASKDQKDRQQAKKEKRFSKVPRAKQKGKKKSKRKKGNFFFFVERASPKKKTEKGKHKPGSGRCRGIRFFYLNDSTQNELAASTQLQKANRAPAAMVRKKNQYAKYAFKWDNQPKIVNDRCQMQL